MMVWHGLRTLAAPLVLCTHRIPPHCRNRPHSCGTNVLSSPYRGERGPAGPCHSPGPNRASPPVANSTTAANSRALAAPSEPDTALAQAGSAT
ncbi:hypothetical protein SAMN04487904_101292 [Actinopolyspora lacussalsi subsp. righensis]|uniref:Uncharacterized protein n=1 Tax=Actinopolyspora righensis TaxID=995060 RepID=A0A1I6X7D8_9ACTN|nr:hypothetical protein SAMN04487904_101292 [Actinopolyspora righensis]